MLLGTSKNTKNQWEVLVLNEEIRIDFFTNTVKKTRFAGLILKGGVPTGIQVSPLPVTSN